MNPLELEEKIVDWAIKRGITAPENAPKQMLKVVEEVGELASGIAKGKQDETIDAIGDVLGHYHNSRLSVGAEPLGMPGVSVQRDCESQGSDG